MALLLAFGYVEGIALPGNPRVFELSSEVQAGRVWQNVTVDRYRKAFVLDLQPTVLHQQSDLGDGLLREWKRPDVGIDRHRGYALYYSWRPAAFTNYGQLIPPTSIADVVVRQADGTEFRLNAFKGKWVFLTVDSGVCDDFCRQKLYKMRQVRLTQGKDMDRIERVWLIDDDTPPSSALTAEYDGTRIGSARGSALLSRLPAATSVRDHIYIVDPLGNLMMRYPRDADPSKMKQDVTKLLKVSRIG